MPSQSASKVSNLPGLVRSSFRAVRGQQPALTWAVVALKSPEHAKTRLAAVLNPAQRRHLLFELAARVIRALYDTPGIDAVAVVTASAEVAAFARDFGALPILQDGEAGTAAAFTAASFRLLPLQPRRLLMIAADLPLVTAEALRKIVAAGEDAGTVVVVPDRHRTGTNALLCAPQTLEPQFGENSFRRHLAAAELASLRARVLEIEALALDLDNPEDLDELRRRGGAPAASLFEGLLRSGPADGGRLPQACAALAG